MLRILDRWEEPLRSTQTGCENAAGFIANEITVKGKDDPVKRQEMLG